MMISSTFPHECVAGSLFPPCMDERRPPLQVGHLFRISRTLEDLSKLNLEPTGCRRAMPISSFYKTMDKNLMELTSVYMSGLRRITMNYGLLVRRL